MYLCVLTRAVCGTKGYAARTPLFIHLFACIWCMYLRVYLRCIRSAPCSRSRLPPPSPKTPPHPLPSLVGRAARGPSSPVPRLSRLCNPPRKARKPNRMRIAACAWSGCECAASAQESSHTCTCTFSARAWGDGEHMIHAPGCLTSLVWSHQGAVLTVTYLNECIWVYLRCIWKMYLCALVSGCVFD